MKVSIVALGRLGTLIYKKLENTTNVIGTFRNKPKGVNEVFFDFNSTEVPLDIVNSDVLIFNLTPTVISDFERFKKFVEISNPKKIIFISSTSVYGNQEVVNENDETLPESISGKLLKKCENYLLESVKNSTIVRPGGIIYETSHPAYFMSSKKIKVGLKERVNLISVNDLVNIIVKILDKNYKIVNVVCAHHPLKKDYYLNYCKSHNLLPPIFEISNDLKFKEVHTKYNELRIESELP